MGKAVIVLKRIVRGIHKGGYKKQKKKKKKKKKSIECQRKEMRMSTSWRH